MHGVYEIICRNLFVELTLLRIVEKDFLQAMHSLASSSGTQPCTTVQHMCSAPHATHYTVVCLIVCVCKSDSKISKMLNSAVTLLQYQTITTCTYVYLCSIYTPYPSTHYTHAHSSPPTTHTQIPSTPSSSILVASPSPFTLKHPGAGSSLLGYSTSYTGNTTETTV